MQVALLGDDPAALPLLRGLLRRPGWRLAFAAGVDRLLPELLPLAPGVRVGDDWAEWLAVGDLVVLVATDRAELLEGARRLAAEGRPLLVLPSAAQGLAWVYEVSLVRDDVAVPLCPWFAHRGDPAVRRLRAALEAGRLGRVVWLELERERTAAGESRPGPALLAAAEIESVLLHDADLLRWLGGDFTQVTSVATGTTETGRAAQAVTLAGEGVPQATWTVRAVPRDPSWKLTVTGERGRAILTGAASGSAVRLALEGLAESDLPESVDEDPLSRLESALRTGRGTGASDAAGPRGEAEWRDVARAFEIVEAAGRSLRRRRTIDLHFETTSERSQFKTHMTALGCGLLAFTLLGVLGVLLLGSSFFGLNRLPWAATLFKTLRVLVFLPLGLFLLLQLLLFVTRAPRRDGEEGEQGSQE
jgi:myo-inositol 2-dehydrogenase/D-chiro-inositol 1-dehydrogenase